MSEKLQHMRRVRKTLNRCREKIRAVRARYLVAVWKRYRFLKKESDRIRVALEISERMKEHGLYAEATNTQDIAYSCMRWWYAAYADSCDRYQRYAHWTSWKQRHG